MSDIGKHAEGTIKRENNNSRFTYYFAVCLILFNYRQNKQCKSLSVQDSVVEINQLGIKKDNVLKERANLISS